MTEADVVGRASSAILKNLAGPMAKDMPYTPYTEATLRRLAGLEPRTLALMHGSTFKGDGGKAILALAEVIKRALGPAEAA
ncbi:MAG TPA: hypothetical protein VGV13_16680 [Methylomirabilota bacterium]|nr:hypothetical protein [Methylomirabilota bacterium]